MVFKRLGLLLGLLIFGTLLLRAQPAFNYGNAWYVPGQSYLKMQTLENGLYRVSASDLAAAGFSVSPSDVAQVQVFHRGVEQYIHVQTNGGNFDYLEFYGRQHDGREDSLFYRSPNGGAPQAGFRLLISKVFTRRCCSQPWFRSSKRALTRSRK